jgi:hypothetical protein
MTLSFAASIMCLGLLQAATVAVPGRARLPGLSRLRSPWWGLVPLGSIVAVVFVLPRYGGGDALTYLALVAVPTLAAAALGWGVHAARPWAAPLVIPLFLLAWLAQGELIGQACAAILTGLSCVALGIALVNVAPLAWLKVGVVAMAVADALLVSLELLQPASAVLYAAAPAAQLPALQNVELGSAVMGYGDLFIAGCVGAILAADGSGQVRGALLTLGLAWAFDLLFFAIDTLPATVPVALALLLVEATRAWSRRPTA